MLCFVTLLGHHNGDGLFLAGYLRMTAAPRAAAQLADLPFHHEITDAPSLYGDTATTPPMLLPADELSVPVLAATVAGDA